MRSSRGSWVDGTGVARCATQACIEMSGVGCRWVLVRRDAGAGDGGVSDK